MFCVDKYFSRVCLFLRNGVFLFLGIETAAVETVRADSFLWQSDGTDQRFQFCELQGVQMQAVCNLVDHAGVFGRVRSKEE